VQAVHRIRSRLVADRVRLVNQVRGLLGEHGIVVAKDIGNLRRALARIAGDDEDRAVAIGYVLAYAAALPVFARLGEIGGRKALYLSGFAFFGLACFSRSRARCGGDGRVS
jgi:transposase